MGPDVRQFILACSTCAENKNSNRPPVGLLQPLPIPSRPWSHLALDFVTGLPPSRGNTVILTVVNCFSKAAHVIPLPKFPSAKETAQTMVDHMFRIHGLLVDVVSDKGPPFVFLFWKEFCQQIGASTSLSSGFHPQTNGQCERDNQDLERALHCLTSQNPISWSQQLSWVEYAHNSLPVASTYVPIFVFNWLPTSSVSFTGTRCCGPICLGLHPALPSHGRGLRGSWAGLPDGPRQQPIAIGFLHLAIHQGPASQGSLS